jgi:SAM-dependent methyltransferase
MSAVRGFESQDGWTRGGAYEPYVGRWSRAVARSFVAWLQPPARAGWLDVGCGTGALTATILEDAEPSSVRAIDPSPNFVDFARAHIVDDRASFAVGTLEELTGSGDRFDYVVSGLVVNFLPAPPSALREMKEHARPGACIAAYVWDYTEGMEMIRHFWDAAIELDENAAALDEATRFPLCRREPLRDLWEEAGLDEGP